MLLFILKNLISKSSQTIPPDRCYYCKKELFRKIQQIAQEHHLNAVLDGSNADDSFDYRPGAKARKELGVISPLKEVGLTKQEIRGLSHTMHLESSEKPAFACLASRFPYGTKITKERLKQDRICRGVSFLLRNQTMPGPLS